MASAAPLNSAEHEITRLSGKASGASDEPAPPSRSAAPIALPTTPPVEALAPWDARSWTGLPAGPALTPEDQTFRWLARPYDFLRECRDALGDTFTLSIKGWAAPHVVLSDPNAIREVLLGSSSLFYAGKGNALLKPFLGPASLFTLDRTEHIRHRRLMLQAFRGERMRAYGLLTRDLARRAVARWPRGKPVAMQELMLDLSLDIIMFAIFGMGDNDAVMAAVKPRMAELLRLISTGLSPLQTAVGGGAGESVAPMTPAAKRLNQLGAETDDLLLEEIERRRFRPDPMRVDMLELLIEGRDESGRGLTPLELRDQIMTLALAGHETTAGALTWALLLIDEHPDVLTRLRQELEKVGPTPEPEALAALPYLGAVCLEVLRVRPVVPAVSRWLTQPAQIAGMNLPGGIFVLPCIYLAHRRAASFSDPDAFRPQRFLDREYSPYEFLPFSGGVRRCIGMSFALNEMRMLLAVILTTVRTTSAARSAIRGVRRGVVVGPSENGRMLVESIAPLANLPTPPRLTA